MNQKGSIVKLVFGSIDQVVSTVENIHQSIAHTAGNASKGGFREGGRRKNVYATIKAVNSKVEELVSGFFTGTHRPGTDQTPNPAPDTHGPRPDKA